MMFIRLMVAAVISACLVISATAGQGPSADEKQIRDLIAAEAAGKPPARTSDRIFWSGNYRRPIVGNESGEEIPGDEQGVNRVPNSQRVKTTVRRIEVAKSGDFAYEFSDSDLSFDLKTGRRVSFPRSMLRIWKKEGEQWKVAASFSHGHDVSRPAAK